MDGGFSWFLGEAGHRELRHGGAMKCKILCTTDTLITQLMQELSNEGAGARVPEPQRARSGSRHKAFFHQLSSSPLNLFRPVDEY
jgi:hypothetical protein